MPIMQLTPEQAQQRQLSEMLRNKGFLCLEYLQGSCTRPNCPYMHVTNGEERPVPEAVCHFFLQTVCLREKCKFFHGTQADLDALHASGRTTYRPQEFMKVALAPSELQHAGKPAPPAASVMPQAQLPLAMVAPPQPPAATAIFSAPQTILPSAIPTPTPLQRPFFPTVPQTQPQFFHMPMQTAAPLQSVMPMMFAPPHGLGLAMPQNQQQPFYVTFPQAQTAVPFVYLQQ